MLVDPGVCNLGILAGIYSTISTCRCINQTLIYLYTGQGDTSTKTPELKKHCPLVLGGVHGDIIEGFVKA